VPGLVVTVSAPPGVRKCPAQLAKDRVEEIGRRSIEFIVARNSRIEQLGY
jgi:hypothetical protein